MRKKICIALMAAFTVLFGVSSYFIIDHYREAEHQEQIEYASDGISFHIIHPPLTRTKSASPLPVPKEFMADPQKVGFGIAKHIFSKRFIICHNFSQKFQTLICYLCPIKMGKLMSKMTVRYVNDKKG